MVMVSYHIRVVTCAFVHLVLEGREYVECAKDCDASPVKYARVMEKSNITCDLLLIGTYADL